MVLATPISNASTAPQTQDAITSPTLTPVTAASEEAYPGPVISQASPESYPGPGLPGTTQETAGGSAYPGPEQVLTPTMTPSLPTAPPATSVDAYPGPALAASPTSGDAYPGPSLLTSPTPFGDAYPGPGTPPGPAPTLPPSGQTPTAAAGTTLTLTHTPQIPPGEVTPSRTVWPSATLRNSPRPTFTPMPGGTGTLTATASPRLPGPGGLPPSSGTTTITIWHSWSQVEALTLEKVLINFQLYYPNIKVNVLALPLDELRSQYEKTAYTGKGPDVLLGPAEWGPALYDKQLVADLSGIATEDFLARINAAALSQTNYKNAIIGLPHTIRSGVILYRNKSIISSPPATYDDLVKMARAATKNGVVGAYLDRGFYYSAAHLYGMGGQMVDLNGYPAFNNAKGIEWLNLLDSFSKAGPAASNSTRDLDLFKAGKVGMIIDGTWNTTSLVESVGAPYLVIDPWPRTGSGHMSGFIQTDVLYLNANVTGDQRYSALLLMGFFLAPEVQSLLTEADHIPVLTGIKVDDPWMQQSMLAFERATGYPVNPSASFYTIPLETAIQAVISKSATPQTALQVAYQAVMAAIGTRP